MAGLRPSRAALLLAAWLTAQAVKADTCEAIGCGQYHPEEDCQCNSKCVGFGNCCTDYEEVCVKAASKTGKGAPPPSPAPQAKPPPPPPPAAVPPPATPPPASTTPPYNPTVSKVLNFDIYRAMAASAVDLHPMEDDDVADLGGVIKYIATEIIVESAGNPLRTNRKYDIDAITKHRFKIRNSDELLKSDVSALGEFGLFVTYDWGQATNTQQVDMLKQYADFVGVQGCAFLQCDPRFPSAVPYSWFSLGNWCPNLPFDKKGTKGAPNAACLTDLHNQPLDGGLCPNGFDAANLIPFTEPTGEPGCVYTYGKAQTVMLDDLVGITSQDCGGVMCRDWLHFRQNCTNKEYKQKFDMATGMVVNVDYCVEHDLHPKCQADCNSPECQAIIKSGNVAYLGLPFWRDRCDPRSNVRRMEQVAHAFGTPGAMTRHQIVDDQVAKAQCPESEGTSSQCTPRVPGQSGPFCTRYFNGACEPCYIPGTAAGPEQKPHCPLDVLSNYPGYEVPKCKSKRASDGCCLYAGTCEGDSNPMTAALDDGGYALIAAKQNTADMAVFMKRAVPKLAPTLMAELSDPSKLDYAAYSAWERGPASQTLAEAVAEFGKNLKGPGPVTTSQTMTTTKLGCFELAMSYQPLDMNGAMMSIEPNVNACQARCSNTKECMHFTFMQTLGMQSGSCHLQDLAATPEPGSVGYVAGPYKCWKDIEDKANLIDIGHHTYVETDLACIQRGLTYAPAMTGFMQVISAPTRAGAIILCQKYCAGTPQCAHFMISFPSGTTGMCTLAGKTAMASNAVGTVSGEPVCHNREKASFFRLFESEDAVRSEPRRFPTLPFAVLAAGVVSAFGFSCSFLAGRRIRRIQRSSRGVADMALEPSELDQEDGNAALLSAAS